jgi:hypothetical protein
MEMGGGGGKEEGETFFKSSNGIGELITVCSKIYHKINRIHSRNKTSFLIFSRFT